MESEKKVVSFVGEWQKRFLENHAKLRKEIQETEKEIGCNLEEYEGVTND